MVPAAARRTASIAFRLGLAMAVILALVVLGTLAAANRYGAAAADEAFDRLLRGAALQIAERVTVTDGTAVVDLPVSAFELLSLARSDRDYYRVIGPDGANITGYGDLPLPARDSGEFQVYDTLYKGAKVRAAVLTRRLAERGVSGSVKIVVAQTRQERQALADRISTQAGITIAIAGIALVLLAIIIVRVALRPLVRVEQAILQRNVNDLSPIEVPAPAEVAVLLEAVNRFMGRLARRLDTMQHFVADAAHQLRTPITALRAQAQLALDEADPVKLDRLHRRIYGRSVGLGRLADQLLSQALISHRAETIPLETIDLRRAALEAERELRAIGTQPIEMILPDEAVEVKGDLISLREALKNLLNNAVKHGVAPIRIMVSAGDGAGPRVMVMDQGTGLPASAAAHIGARFTSDGISADSAGLGLSIAAAVATSHGARLVFGWPDAGGFEIGLQFPPGAK